MRRIDGYLIPFRVRERLFEAAIRAKALTPTAMARYARETTPFYRSFYEGFDPGDFTRLPILEKHLLRDISPFDLLAEPYRGRARHYGETTGSTGSPTPVFYTAHEYRLPRWLALCSTHLEAFRAQAPTAWTAVNGMAFGLTIAGASFGAILEESGGLVADVGSRSTLATPPRIARTIARLRPSVIAAAPIDLLSWMRLVQEEHPSAEDAVVDALRLVVSSAELCARSRSARIEEHFGVSHADTYACVEGFFCQPCTCGERHVLPAYHVELMDDALRPLPVPGTGRIAFTNLVKRSSPLVRYLLDDWVTLRASSCPHGFGLNVIPHGRAELNLDLRGEIVNVEQMEEAIFAHGLFGDYRVVVHLDRLEVTIEEYAPRRDPPTVVEDHLRQRFGLPARVHYVPFGTITEYRKPRGRKPILKVHDARPTSRQVRPEFL